MQITAVNEHAQKRYKEFTTAIAHVHELIIPIDKLIGRMDKPNARYRGWRMKRPDELKAIVKKLRNQLELVTEQAKKYEKELISRDWRV